MITFLPAFLSLAVMVRVPAPGVVADDAQALGIVVPKQWLRPRPRHHLHPGLLSGIAGGAQGGLEHALGVQVE